MSGDFPFNIFGLFLSFQTHCECSPHTYIHINHNTFSLGLYMRRITNNQYITNKHDYRFIDHQMRFVSIKSIKAVIMYISYCLRCALYTKNTQYIYPGTLYETHHKQTITSNSYTGTLLYWSIDTNLMINKTVIIYISNCDASQLKSPRVNVLCILYLLM